MINVEHGFEIEREEFNINPAVLITVFNVIYLVGKYTILARYEKYIYIKLDTCNYSEIHQHNYFVRMTKYCVGIDSELIDKTV